MEERGGRQRQKQKAAKRCSAKGHRKGSEYHGRTPLKTSRREWKQKKIYIYVRKEVNTMKELGEEKKDSISKVTELKGKYEDTRRKLNT